LGPPAEAQIPVLVTNTTNSAIGITRVNALHIFGRQFRVQFVIVSIAIETWTGGITSYMKKLEKY
jgi:hypothetical protein